MTLSPSFQHFPALPLLEALQDPAWLCDPTGQHFHINQNYQRQFQTSAFTLQGLGLLLPEPHREPVVQHFLQHIAASQPFTLTFPILEQKELEQKEEVWYELTVTPMHQNQVLLGFLGVLHPLKSTEGYLEALLENAPVGLGVIGPDYRHRVLNNQVHRHTPHDREVHLQSPLSDLYPKSFPLLKPILDGVFQTGKPADVLEFESRYPREPFEKAHWRVQYFPVKTRDGQMLGVGFVSEDIRELKRKEQQLEAQHRFLEDITQNIPATLTVRNQQTGELLLDNGEMARLLGYSREAFRELSLQEFTFEDNAVEVQAMLEKVRSLKPGEVFKADARLKCKDGSACWVSGQMVVFEGEGHIPLVMHTAIDITARVEAEQQLQQSQQLFKRVTDTAPVMLWMVDEFEQASFFNPEWLKFTGRTLQEEIGWGWARGVHEDDFEPCTARYRPCWDNRQPYQMEYRLRHHDGTYRWVWCRGEPWFDDQGNFKGYIGGNIDVHDRKLTQQRLELRELELREMVRREQQFLRDAAHEFRNPLAVMQGNVDMLRRHPNLPKNDRLEIVSEVQDATTRLSRLINDMLLLARGDMDLELTVQEVNLSDVLEEAWDDVRTLNPHHQYHWRVDGALTLQGDPERLSQLFMELLENAVKYTPRGKAVQLHGHKVEGGVEVVVKDSGVGIREEDLPRIFERFFRVDPSRQRGEHPESTGLGLPIARWIVEQHQGQIQVNSQPGEGTMVRVWLPHQA